MSTDSSHPLHQQFAALISGLNKATQNVPTSTAACYHLLKSLRASFYENLNQLQHAYLVSLARAHIDALLSLPSSAMWKEHPMQTGDDTEPDLCVRAGATILASAEVTTSDRPDGVIDSRMRDTLAKLAKMQGRLFYFVTTTAMQKRAVTKVEKAGYSIDVVRLHPS